MRRHGGLKLRPKTSLFVLTAAGLAAYGSSDSANTTNFPLSFLNGVVRSSRALFTVRICFTFFSISPELMLLKVSILQITSCVLDYKYSLHGLPADSDEYGSTVSQVLKSSAILGECFALFLDLYPTFFILLFKLTPFDHVMLIVLYKILLLSSSHGV